MCRCGEFGKCGKFCELGECGEFCEFCESGEFVNLVSVASL